MKDRIALGLIAALIYGAFVGLVPHKYPRNQGMETDLIMAYVHGAYYLKEGTRLWSDLEPFKTQGLGLPLVLAIFGGLFDPPQRTGDYGDRQLPGWGYFTAGKWVSLLSAMAVILLLFVWLGMKAGLIASIALGVSPLFFELSYSGCTDVFAVSLILWAAYSAFRGKPLLAGILFGYAAITRYEFILFSPFAFWCFWRFSKPKSVLAFLAPAAVLLALNFSVAEFPPSGGKYNLALHYLNDQNQPDMFLSSKLEQHPSVMSIIFADPLYTLKIFLRDLWNLIAKIGMIQIWPVLFFTALLSLSLSGDGTIRPPYRKVLILALAAHFLLICFTVFHHETIRYFLIEIIALTMLGSHFISKLRWGKLFILLPIFIFNFNLLAVEVKTQVGRTSEIYKPIGQYVGPEDSIMSLRPTLAFVNGVKWRYWPLEEKNIYIYCNDQDIDFVYWGGFEMFNRPEWGGKFKNADAAMPEFLPIYYDDYGVLLYVNKADSVKRRYDYFKGNLANGRLL